MAIEVGKDQLDYPLTGKRQNAAGALRATDLGMLVQLSTLLRDLRDELGGPTLKNANIGELSELKGQVMETMERAVSGPAGPRLEGFLRPWMNEMCEADSAGLRLLFEGMLRWLEGVLEHLEEVLSRVRLAVIAHEWE